MVSLPASTLKFALVGSHFMQWASSVIVMGIVSYYISKFDAGQHLKYEEIIVRGPLILSRISLTSIGDHRDCFLPPVLRPAILEVLQGLLPAP
jgi:hypothetical protein